MSVLAANVAYALKRREFSRQLIVAAAFAAPLLWLFSLAPLVALFTATLSSLAPWRHELASYLSALPRERV